MLRLFLKVTNTLPRVMENVDHGRPPAGGNYLSNRRMEVKIDVHLKDLQITSVAVADYTQAYVMLIKLHLYVGPSSFS